MNSEVRRICHVQMNHNDTLAIDQSQGFVTYLWEDFNQNTMYNKVNEKTHSKEYKREFMNENWPKYTMKWINVWEKVIISWEWITCLRNSL